MNNKENFDHVTESLIAVFKHPKQVLDANDNSVELSDDNLVTDYAKESNILNDRILLVELKEMISKFGLIAIIDEERQHRLIDMLEDWQYKALLRLQDWLSNIKLDKLIDNE